MRCRLLLIAALGLLAAPPAVACSMTWRPFEQDLARLGPDGWALRARTAVAFDTFNDEIRAGTVTLSTIRCLRKPQRAACPRSINIRFVDRNDGINCSSPFSHQASRLRYFILYRNDEGEWLMSRAERSRWAVRP